MKFLFGKKSQRKTRKVFETPQSTLNSNTLSSDDIYSNLEKKIVFIFGTPRSGSTWLKLIIHRQKRIRSIDEPMLGAQLGAFNDNPAVHWNLFIGNHAVRFSRILDQDRNDLFFSPNFEHSWRKSLRIMILDRIIAQFGNEGYDHVVIKAPNESHAADLIMQTLPKSKLIFLIRDGRDVIDSRQGKFHNPGSLIRPETPEERKFRISHFALMWNIMIEATQKAYDNHEPKLRLLVKYEDLRINSFDEIARIYKFLGYNLKKEELKNIVEQTSFENVPENMKGKDKNIRKAKPGGFKEYFTNEELELVHKMIKDNLKKYNYEI
jgi:hypothetical protein